MDLVCPNADLILPFEGGFVRIEAQMQGCESLQLVLLTTTVVATAAYFARSPLIYSYLVLGIRDELFLHMSTYQMQSCMLCT